MKNNRLVGRSWLIDEIREELFEENLKRHMILTANMGYGKSALISHLVCADEGDYGSDIRQHILSYHVCKFDVLSTKNPAIFIRRLVGLIGIRVPEFGSYVSMLPNTSIVFDKNICEQDANGCFDQAVLFPLQDLTQPPKERQIILLDALDECTDGDKGVNKISELIRLRAHTLPPWLTILLTSREPVDNSLAKYFHVKTLSAEDERNYKDIKTYIQERTDHSMFKLQHLFGSRSKPDLVETLVKKSGGNFLFLTHALEYWESQNGTLRDDDIPQSLERIYELNFERLFGPQGHEFSDAKAVLEIICASLYQIHQTELAKILRVGDISHMSEKQFGVALKDLSFFLKIENGLLTFTHLSIRNWLISNDNQKFQVSVKVGASRISEYLFHDFKIQNMSDISLLAVHVALSNSIDLEEKFISVMKNETKLINDMRVLHDIVKKADLPKAVDLVSSHYENIDIKDIYGLTASAIAAIEGHIKVFKRLIDLKANITTVTGFGIQRKLVNVPGTDIFSGMNRLINHYPYENCSLLHIACQFGHLNIVEYIMTLKPSLSDARNMYGRLPIDLACEHGHDSIVRYFQQVHNLRPNMDCLYLATRNQHEIIVKMILSSKDFEYRCASDEQVLNAYMSVIYDTYENFDDKLHLFISNVSNHFPFRPLPWYLYDIVRPLDIWWKIKKESPLHIAARTGNVEIFKSIVSAFPESLNCVDSGGLTPTFTSIRHGSFEIFKFCVDMKRETDTCVVQSQLIKELYDKFMTNQCSCVAGMTVTHFLAIYGTLEIIVEAYKRIRMDFYGPDDNSVTPVHYASCNGNIYFLIIADRTGVKMDDIFTANGSSTYHSATSCLSLTGLMALDNHLNPKGISPLLDSFNMSILHYLAMLPVEKTWAYLAEETEKQVLSLLLFALNKSNTNLISRVDKSGKNFLHYALLNGHFLGVQYFLDVYTAVSKKMLTQRDIYGKDPVTYTIRRLQRIENHGDLEYRVPRTYHYLNLFTGSDVEKNLANLTWFMSPVELCLFRVISFASKHGLMDDIINEHLGSLMLKTKMYLVDLVLLLNKNTNYNFDQQIIEAVTDRPEPHNIFALIVLNSRALFKCKRLDSPVHALAEYIDQILQYIRGSDAKQLMIFLFKNRLKLLESCLDSYGRTIYERAIKGKSLIFIAHLINYNMLQLQSNITVFKLLRSIINLNNTLASADNVVLNFEVINEEEPGTLLTYQKVYRPDSYVRAMKDELVVLILEKSNMSDSLDIFCQYGKGFSLVHIAAASNMYKTIEALSKVRPDILICETEDKVTALYLAKMFKAEETVKVLENVTLVYPKKEFEKVFIFKLSILFADSVRDHPYFWLLNNMPEKRIQSEHKQRLIMRVFEKILCIKKPFIGTVNDINYFYIFWHRECDYIKGTLRFFRRGLSLMNEMFSDKTMRKSCRTYQIFLSRFQTYLSQVNKHTLPFEFYFLPDLSSIPDDLMMYSYLWKKLNLFEGFERCSVVKSNRNVIMILHHFTRKLLHSVLQRTHEFIFRSLVSQDILSPRKKVERYNLYFNMTSILFARTKRYISVEEMTKYRFINRLRGFADFLPLLSTGNVKVRKIQVETVTDTET